MSFQLAPPSRHQNEDAPLLAEASLLGSPDMQFPSLNLNRYGDPLANLISDSDGQGSRGGMGNGNGTGIDDGDGVYKPGSRGVGYPTCAYCPDAKYSEEARKAKYQGVVLLQMIISADGRATNIEVVRGPGLDLDEQAVAAVKTWRFKPALGPNRAPVATRIAIEFQFRLL
jgi:TonB family protein